MSHNDDRDKAIRWARRILTQDFVVIDTETTGVKWDAEVVQIGIVDKTGKVLLDTLVKPVQPIPAEASAIHGITNETVKNTPTFEQVYPQLVKILHTPVLLSYNAPFDSRIIFQSARLYNLTTVGDGVWHCVMDEFARFYGEWNDYHGNYKWQKLTTAARHFGISTNGAHGAVADALMTLKVVEGMAASKTQEEKRQ